MKISTRNATIILTNSESRDAGYHDTHTPDGRDADAKRRSIRKAAHDLAARTGRTVDVYGTQRGCQDYMVYTCDSDGNAL